MTALLLLYHGLGVVNLRPFLIASATTLNPYQVKKEEKEEEEVLAQQWG